MYMYSVFLLILAAGMNLSRVRDTIVQERARRRDACRGHRCDYSIDGSEARWRGNQQRPYDEDFKSCSCKTGMQVCPKGRRSRALNVVQ